MQKLSFKAFTLVELIVVITILAILATIGYVSILGYGVTARDTTRLSDINNISKVLELYKVQEGVYPPVTNPVNVTFSGGTIWQQGSFGEDTRKIAKRISQVPIDPLTGNEYAYSRTTTTGEFQVGTIVEKASTLSSLPDILTQQTYAVENPLKAFATTLIKGNYNGKFIVHKEEDTIYILGVPSILSDEITDVTLQQIFTNNSFVYEGGPTPPATYSGSLLDNGTWTFTPTDTTGETYLIHTGSLSEMNTGTGKIDFIGNLKTYYTATDVASSDSYKELISINTTTNPNGAITLVNTYIQSGIGGLGDDDFLLTEVDISGEQGEITDPNCYESANIGTVGSWTGCDGMLIVDRDDILAATGTGGGVDYYIEHMGTQYTFGDSVYNVFVGQVTDMSYLFGGRTAFNADIGYWDVSNVTNMLQMFVGSISGIAFNQDISEWDVSSVENMQRMFIRAPFFNQDISEWDVSSVITMQEMFARATEFNQDISEWDVSSVITMEEMFASARDFNQDISEWDVSGVENMRGMFSGQYATTTFNQPIGTWNVGSVTNTIGMFYNSDAFNQPLGGWDTSSVESMQQMFEAATVFDQDISGWDTSAATSCWQFDNFTSAGWTAGEKPTFTLCSP